MSYVGCKPCKKRNHTQEFQTEPKKQKQKIGYSSSTPRRKGIEGIADTTKDCPFTRNAIIALVFAGLSNKAYVSHNEVVLLRANVALSEALGISIEAARRVRIRNQPMKVS